MCKIFVDQKIFMKKKAILDLSDVSQETLFTVKHLTRMADGGEVRSPTKMIKLDI